MDSKGFRQLVLVGIVGFLMGVSFCVGGYVLYKKAKPFIVNVKHKIKERWIANLPKAKDILVLSDFEDRKEIERWETIGASISITNKEAIDSNSGELVFYPNNEASVVKLEKFFDDNPKKSNWSGYEVLVFDVYNPNSSNERIILQIKDKDGRKIKQDLYLKAGEKRRFKIDIANLWEELYPTKIAQFNLFLWNNTQEKRFYLDNVKLVSRELVKSEGIGIFSPLAYSKSDEKAYAIGDYFSFEPNKWQKEDGCLWIPLVLRNYLNRGKLIDGIWRGGVPLPRGKIYGVDKFRIIDNEGNILPAQFKIIAFWPDKSIKWLLVTTKSQVLDKKDLFLVYGKERVDNYDKEVFIKSLDDGLIVSNGIIQVFLPKSKGTIIAKGWYDKNGDGVFGDDEVVIDNLNPVLVYKDKKYSGEYESKASLVVEDDGRIYKCIRKEGWFVNSKGDKYCKYIVRVYVSEGDSNIKLKHTLIYTGYPENNYHYLYKGKRLPENETIEQFGIDFNLSNLSKKIYYELDGKIVDRDVNSLFSIFQDSDSSLEIIIDDKKESFPTRYNGALVLNNSIGLMVKEFWQQFPKRISYNLYSGTVSIDFWPKEAGELDLRTTERAYGPDAVARGSAFGLAKTHDLVIDLACKGEVIDLIAALEGSISDIVLLPSIEWILETSAIGRLPNYDINFRIKKAKEAFINSLFSWGNRQIEQFRWYGMIDFGDTLSWYRKDAFDKSYDDWGWHPEGRWGWFNCEAMGTHTGALLHFWRSQDYEYYFFGARLARHIMDIDTCHYNTLANDSRLKGIIPDDYSQVGSMHRHNGDHWGGRNEETSHTNITGLVYYYYISGDERAREVIEEVGSFFLKERITYFNHPDIAPTRNLANVLWGYVFLYELSGDEKYRKETDKFAEIICQGQRYDGAWLDTYNPVKRKWEGKPSNSFTINYVLPALISYHRLNQNKTVKDVILSATDYIMESEPYTPYFEALSYAYWLSGEDKYLDKINERLTYFINHQRMSKDPLWDGMIYQKLYYMRVAEFLYQFFYCP
ncbi:MAG: glycoside hydrolase family 127 protein [Candidatus Omnitrophica bacterium]|nr:glycoside hydrolase family 127 protein [Candidatus Omnitrophota bacterium]MCM8826814.1 glycoside hydrolase family 127 protein [Candidatus Omnitrophota bacterium]